MTPKNASNARIETIREHMARLNAYLQQEEDREGLRTTWAHEGSLAHVETRLAQIIESIEGIRA